MNNLLYVNPWDLSEEQARERYEKLSRRLNDRMREMDRRGITTEAVEKYQMLVEDLTDGNKRLPKTVSLEDARSALNRVQDILEMRGSSWKNTKEFSLKGMKTFREKYGIRFDSVAQYTRFWASEQVQTLKKWVPSNELNKVAEMFTSDNDVMKKAAEDFLKTDSEDPMELLKALGFDSMADFLKFDGEETEEGI